MKEIFEKITNFIFPPKCAACGEILPYYSLEFLCDECKEKWTEESSVKCEKCKKSYSGCKCLPESCEGFLTRIISVSSYMSSGSVTDRLVLLAKDSKNKKLFEFMSNEMVSAAYGEIDAFDDTLFTYVPRSRWRKFEIGHDQSEILSKMIAERFEAEMIPLFIKRGRVQQKALNAKKRIINAEKSYIPIENIEKYVNNKHIILCDDVVTTGASLSACAKLLKENGAKSIISLTFAKTPKQKQKI